MSKKRYYAVFTRRGVIEQDHYGQLMIFMSKKQAAIWCYECDGERMIEVEIKPKRNAKRAPTKKRRSGGL